MVTVTGVEIELQPVLCNLVAVGVAQGERGLDRARGVEVHELHLDVDAVDGLEDALRAAYRDAPRLILYVAEHIALGDRAGEGRVDRDNLVVHARDLEAYRGGRGPHDTHGGGVHPVGIDEVIALRGVAGGVEARGRQ